MVLTCENAWGEKRLDMGVVSLKVAISLFAFAGKNGYKIAELHFVFMPQHVDAMVCVQPYKANCSV